MQVPYNIGDPGAGVAQQSGIPDDYIHVSVNPDQFGAQIGQATEKLGGALDKGASTAADIIDQRKQSQNETDVNATYANQFSPAFRQQVYDYKALSGKAAVDQRDATVANLEALRVQTRDSIDNPAQRRMFDELSRKHAELELDGIYAHANQQNQVYHLQTSNATLQDYTNTAADHADDPKVFGTMLNSIYAETRGYGAGLGVTDGFKGAGQSAVEMDQRAQQWYDRAWDARINKIAAVDPQKALTMLTAAQHGQDSTAPEGTPPVPPISGLAAADLYRRIAPAALQAGAAYRADDAYNSLLTGYAKSQQQAPTTGVAGVVDRIIGKSVEGNGQNPSSTAVGTGQFIDGTWKQMVHTYRPDLEQGRTPEQVLALRSDPVLGASLGREMTQHYAEENAAKLSAQGLPVTPGTIYLAHFLGPADAANVLRADPAAPLVGVIQDSSIKSNPSVLKGKTAQDVINFVNNKMAGVSADPSAPAAATGQDQPLPPLRQSVADYARNNREAMAEQVYADALKPDAHGNVDITAAQQAKQGFLSRVDSLIRGEEMKNTADGHMLTQAMMGNAQGQGGEVLTTPEQLMAISDAHRTAYLNMMTANPTAFAAINAQLLKNAGGQDATSYGQEIKEAHALATAPGAASVWSPSSPVLAMWNDGKITIAGMNFLEQSQARAGNPKGTGDNIQLQSALSSITQLGYDPKAFAFGEKLPLADGTGSKRVSDAQSALLAELKDGETKGLTYSTMLDTRNKDNVLDKVLHTYRSAQYDPATSTAAPVAGDKRMSTADIGSLATPAEVIAALTTTDAKGNRTAKSWVGVAERQAAEKRLSELDPGKYGAPATPVAPTPVVAPATSQPRAATSPPKTDMQIAVARASAAASLQQGRMTQAEYDTAIKHLGKTKAERDEQAAADEKVPVLGMSDLVARKQ